MEILKWYSFIGFVLFGLFLIAIINKWLLPDDDEANSLRDMMIEHPGLMHAVMMFVGTMLWPVLIWVVVKDIRIKIRIGRG